MPYHKRSPKFGKKTAQRKALLTSLIRSLIIHEKILTTETRAKTIKPLLEKMITKTKKGKEEVSIKRFLLSKFNNDEKIVSKLIENISKRYTERDGGYLRVLKVESRLGSGRTLAIIEFV